MRIGLYEGLHVELTQAEHVDAPLPKLDVAALLKAERPTAFVPNLDLRTVSVEVMSVVHTSVVPVQRDTTVFYDGEVLVVVHRAKSRESGLVVTKVWCWKGKKCHFGEREEKKVAELARRYGTLAVRVFIGRGYNDYRTFPVQDGVDQRREPAELVHVLGGQLAIRQVRRNVARGCRWLYWSPRALGPIGPPKTRRCMS